jgi:hypothetical protein
LTGAPTRLRQQPLLLAEVLAALCLASLMIRLLPFRTVTRIAAARARHGAAATREQAEMIARALRAVAAKLPWRALCFEQGLAALLMLRRRRLAATLFYGAAIDTETALVAHVWVRSGETDVAGCEIAYNFRVIAQFPDNQS